MSIVWLVNVLGVSERTLGGLIASQHGVGCQLLRNHPTMSCLLIQRRQSLVLVPLLLWANFWQISSISLSSCLHVIKFDPNPVLANLPVVHIKRLLKVGQQADRALELLHLSVLDWRKSAILQGTCDSIGRESVVKTNSREGSNAATELVLIPSVQLLPGYKQWVLMVVKKRRDLVFTSCEGTI